MDNNNPTIADLIDLSIAAERINQELYLQLARRFPHVPEVAAHLEDIAAEEHNHALWLERLRTRLEPATLNSPADAEMFQSARASANIPLGAMLEKITDLEDDHQFISEFENSETNAIFSFVISHFSADPSSEPFLRSQITSHIQRATQLPAPYHTVIARQNVMAQNTHSPNQAFPAS
jgi:hypothetical protein